jgi:hypothetical protein
MIALQAMDAVVVRHTFHVEQKSKKKLTSARVVFYSLRLVQNYPEKHHTMQHTPLIFVRLFPPSNLLLRRLTINRWLVLRVTLHHLTVRGENDVDALQDIKRMV